MGDTSKHRGSQEKSSKDRNKHSSLKEKSRKESEEKANKLKVADVLVKLLVPFLKNGSIACKSTFKVLARELTHRILQAGLGGGAGISSSEAQIIVMNFFSQQS